MGHLSRITPCALAALLTACSTYVAPPIGPDEPVAELYGTGNFSMTTPVVDQKGCYQGNLAVDSRPGAQTRRVRANHPLVVTIDGSVGIYRCRDMVKFKPEAGRKYVAHGLVGRDDRAPETSVFQRMARANTEHCHIEIFDDTKDGEAVRIAVERTEPRQRGFACIKF